MVESTEYLISGTARRAIPTSVSVATVALGVVLAHLFCNFVAILTGPKVNVLVLQPLAWLLTAAAAVWLLGYDRRRLTRDREFVLVGFGHALVLVCVMVVVGIVTQFGWSPYNHEFLGVAKNIWYVASMLVAREICRWLIVDQLRIRSEAMALTVAWATLSITALPVRSLMSLQDPASAFEFIGRLLLPMLAIQFLATYLSFRGGPLASLAYLGPILAFEWLSPILPNSHWMLAAIVGVSVPMFGLLMLEEAASSSDATVEHHEHLAAIGPSKGVLVAAALVVAYLWFSTGIIGVKPTIVHGISMEPTYQTGDVVITRDVDSEALVVGDVIVFSVGSRDVVHRIIELRNDETGLHFITLGDNNKAPDSPVPVDKVTGKVVMRIPKVGWPSVAIKRTISWVAS